MKRFGFAGLSYVCTALGSFPHPPHRPPPFSCFMQISAITQTGNPSTSPSTSRASATAASPHAFVTISAPSVSGPLNMTKDGELSRETRAAMRDDTRILTEVFRCIPSNGAISIKSLAAQLSDEVVEAVSEQHGGLRAFLEHRKQMFLLKPRPSDSVIFVAANPLAAQRAATMSMQRKTMRKMMGLDAPRGRRGRGFSRSSHGGRGRGGGDRGRRPSGENDSGGSFRGGYRGRGERGGSNGSRGAAYRGGRGGRGSRGEGRGNTITTRKPWGPVGSSERTFGSGEAS